MTRIIGGSARGRRLKTPTGDQTRPTSDRVREALFSSLEARLGSLSGAGFLDLYAGSGAVGLEALSRGASTATLVEQDRRTAALIRANADTVGLTGATVVMESVGRFLAGEPVARFAVAFADPPYALSRATVEAELAALAAFLEADALVVVERGTRDGGFDWPQIYSSTGVKAYGETTLHFARADGVG